MNLGASVIKWIFVGVMAAVPYGLRWFYTGELPSALQPSPIWGGLALCAFSIGVMYYVSRSELYDSYVSTEPFWRKTLNVLMTLAAMAAFLYALVATVSLPFAEAIGDPDLIMRANIISNVGVTATICLLAYLLIVAPKWVVPGGRLVVFGKGSLLYPGEAYRMWPWNVYERRLFSHEERISLPLLELLCEDGTCGDMSRAQTCADVDNRRATKGRSYWSNQHRRNTSQNGDCFVSQPFFIS
ncbi:MAG: hypothetical protein UY09_C0021G0013, partial [Parcubacteria group bacterium GW2011_GWA2_47_8]